MRKLAAAAVVAIAMAAALAWAFRADPVLVDLAEIRSGPIETTVTDEGVARIRDVFEITAPVGGRVLRAARKVGDWVNAGDVVAVIEPQAPTFLDTRSRAEQEAAASAAEAALDLARADLKRAMAELEFWRHELERQQTLRRSNTISAQKLEQTRLEYAVREAAVATAEAAVALSERELERRRALLIEPDDLPSNGAACCLQVRSPADGRVLEVAHESAHVVQAGATLLTVGDPRRLEISIDLLSADAIRIEEGARARIERWGRENALDARVRRIEPVAFTKVSALGIEEQRVRVLLDIATPLTEWRPLGHNYRVDVSIIAESRDVAVLVPVSALFRQGRDWAVFAAREGAAALTTIRIGLANRDVAEVLEGLRPGDRVVLHPSDRLLNGVRIAERAAL